MTQLPEVEVLRKDLEKEIAGKRFKDVTVKTASLVSRVNRTRPNFVSALEGRKIESVTRRGTWLLFELDDDQVLAMRIGPQGTLTRETATADPGKHTQVVATFTTGGALHYVDPTKEGELFVVDVDELDEHPELTPEGIDPLTDTFTWPAFSATLTTRQTRLKKLLVDETFMVGLGDVYADEILWAAGLAGTRVSNTLSSQEVRRLYRSVLEVLYEAVKQGGTSESVEGEHVDLFGDKGEYGEYLKVFGREGEPCQRCRQPIERIRLETDLYSFHCANCQT